MPGAGHFAWLEQPDRVAGYVTEFLREQTAKSSVGPAEQPHQAHQPCDRRIPFFASRDPDRIRSNHDHNGLSCRATHTVTSLCSRPFRHFTSVGQLFLRSLPQAAPAGSVSMHQASGVQAWATFTTWSALSWPITCASPLSFGLS